MRPVSLYFSLECCSIAPSSARFCFLRRQRPRNPARKSAARSRFYDGTGSSGSAFALSRGGLPPLRSLRRATRGKRRSAGSPTTLVITKNHGQPIFSDNHPPEEATTVRPSNVIDESSAY